MLIIVAGMVVLDLIPSLPNDAAGFSFKPGVISRTGPARVATGGCVANTGGTLHKLGVPVRLIGRVGDDPFGGIVRDLLADSGDLRLAVAPGEATAHSFVFSPPGHDRMILNHPGANGSFSAADVTDDALVGARLFHFGYPSAMRGMAEDNGRELIALLRRVRAAGLATSLDMSYPDPNSPAGGADWPGILAAALPMVDVFMPSLAEAVPMLDPGGGSGGDDTPADRISRMGQRMISLGAAIGVVKLGVRGLYLRTASRQRLAAVTDRLPLDAAEWADRELWAGSFAANLVGTTGAGDATAAGFLLALARGMSPEDAATAACAVGASSVEAIDATGAIRSWEEIAARIAAGWIRRSEPSAPGWRPAPQYGIYRGPADRA